MQHANKVLNYAASNNTGGGNFRPLCTIGTPVAYEETKCMAKGHMHQMLERGAVATLGTR